MAEFHDSLAEVAQCLEHAAACRKQAETAGSLLCKDLICMAETWERLADRYERVRLGLLSPPGQIIDGHGTAT
jgi:hypothetical protein